MKTSVQELKERLIGIGFTNVDEFINQYLEKNKSEIIKAYDDAFKYVVGGGFVAKTGKQYFDEMYNDKK